MSEPCAESVDLNNVGDAMSGKSTLRIQMHILYGERFSMEYRKSWRGTILGVLVLSARLIIMAMKDRGIDFEDEVNYVHSPLCPTITCKRNTLS